MMVLFFFYRMCHNKEYLSTTFLGHPFRASVRLRRVRAGRRQGQRQQQRRQQRVADGGGRGAGHGAAGAAELPRRLLCARRAAAAPRARRRARRHLARAGNSRLDGKPLGRGPKVSGHLGLEQAPFTRNKSYLSRRINSSQTTKAVKVLRKTTINENDKTLNKY